MAKHGANSKHRGKLGIIAYQKPRKLRQKHARSWSDIGASHAEIAAQFQVPVRRVWWLFESSMRSLRKRIDEVMEELGMDRESHEDRMQVAKVFAEILEERRMNNRKARK